MLLAKDGIAFQTQRCDTYRALYRGFENPRAFNPTFILENLFPSKINTFELHMFILALQLVV
jgi:hypothetical protein